MAGGYVSRSRVALRDEVKQKRKVERKVQLEGVPKARSKVEGAGVAKESSPMQRGHGKALDAEFITDTCYPDDSLLPINEPFEKGWLVTNSGSKKWKHVRLVHTGGFVPLRGVLEVAEVKPGETVELVAQYRALEVEDTDVIKSQWRLVHKGTTYFGPRLWLNAYVDKPTPLNPPSPSCPPDVEEPLEFAPVTISHFPPPPAQSAPGVEREEEEEKLTNENLLKSIGFIPGPSSSNGAAPVPEQPASADNSAVFINIDDSMLTSTDKLLDTFEMINVSSAGMPHPPSEGVIEDAGGMGNIDDGFVVVVPDCFDLDKPLADFSLASLSYVTESFDFVDPSTRSHDGHVSPSTRSYDGHVSLSTRSYDGHVSINVAPSAAQPSAPSHSPACDSHVTFLNSHMSGSDGSKFDSPAMEPLPSGSAEPVDPTCDDTSGPESSPPAAHRSPVLLPTRLTLRNLKGGLYRNPLAVATGVVSAVSGFVDDKVHFTPYTGTEKRPMMEFSAVSAESSDDEFEDAQDGSSDDSKDSEPKDPAPSAPPTLTDPTPSAPPPEDSRQIWETQQCDVRDEEEEDVSQWCFNPDISHLLPRRWDGPHQPVTPMERLVAMGFADRARNQELLEKHNNVIQDVLNELLDQQNEAFGDNYV